MRTEGFIEFEVEAGVLGALLANPDRFYELPAGFTSAAFAPGRNRRAFEALERLMKRSPRPTGSDLALVAAEAKFSDAERGALSLVVEASVGNALPQYAAKLMDRRRRSEIRGALVEAADALNGEAPTDEVLSGLTGKILDADKPEKPEVVGYTEAALETMEAFDAEHSGKSRVLKTGFPDLDKRVRIFPGNVVVLAARPGLGKSTLALNIAGNVAKAGHVLFHSLEMSRVELIARDVAAAGHIKLDSILGDQISRFELEKLGTEMDRRSRDSKLLINDSHYGLGAIERITEKAHRKHGLRLVVVDYLQLVESGLKGQNREAQVSAVSRGLKKLAQHLGIPVLALSQLNRQAVKRGDSSPRGKKNEPAEPQRIPAPELHDLRESGAIEQDANVVLMLHHPDAESNDREKREHGPYELLIKKVRMGKPGSVSLRAELDYARFVSVHYGSTPTHWSEAA